MAGDLGRNKIDLKNLPKPNNERNFIACLGCKFILDRNYNNNGNCPNKCESDKTD